MGHRTSRARWFSGSVRTSGLTLEEAERCVRELATQIRRNRSATRELHAPAPSLHPCLVDGQGDTRHHATADPSLPDDRATHVEWTFIQRLADDCESPPQVRVVEIATRATETTGVTQSLADKRRLRLLLGWRRLWSDIS